MNTRTTKNSIQRMPLSVCAMMFALSVVFVPSAFMQQQGGPYTMTQSVIAGGGGASTNANTALTGTIGQGALGLSIGGQFSLNAGFWQGGAPCAAVNISSQPISQAVCVGAPVGLSVTINGAASAYQWRKNGVNIANGGNMSGALSAALTVNPAGLNDAASYDVVISGSCGAPVTSDAATLSVNGYLLSSTGQSFPAAGGGGSVNVTTAASCGWTAVSNNGFIVVTSNQSASGNGTVTYTVAPNTGAGRTGTITIAGQTFTVNQASPTAITLVSLNATSYDDGVFIEWQTGFEVDNLGFNLYRDEGGKPVRVNSQLLAGSGLKVGHGITLGSGCSYSWWDRGIVDCGSGIADCKSAAYWLEDVDLNGTSTWHGPFRPTQPIAKQRPASVTQAKTLAALSTTEAPAVQVESRTGLPAPGAGPSAAGQLQSIIASSPDTVKLQVKREAWYRVTAQELFNAGLDRSVDPRSLQLFVDGAQQAISITGQDDGQFNPTDAIEFYGLGIDSPYSELRTYYLAVGKQAGLRIAGIQSPAHPSPSGSFPYTVERRDRTIYFAALHNGDKENFFGSVVAGQAVSQSLTLNHVEPSIQAAILTLALQGVTNLPHVVSVQVNGNNVGQLSFQGQAAAETTISLSSSMLTEGINQVTLVALGGPADVSLVDHVRLTYQHSFTAEDNALKFNAAAGRQITIGGFSRESIRLFDVTDPSAVREVTGHLSKSEQGGYSVSVLVPGNGQRSLLATTNDTPDAVASLAADYPSNLHNPAQDADLLIVTRRELFDSARPLVALRQREGLSVAVVDIDDIYDEFSFGQKSPQAVKDFLALGRTLWKKPVRYILVLGDASCDPKNYLGLGDFDLVPTRLIDTTFMETASDDWLTDFDGDGIADVPVGRLPVRNASEASLMIAKIVDYEQSFPAEEALLVSDLNDGINFEGSSELLIPLIPNDTRVTHIKRGQLGDQATRAALMDLINRGQRIVNYNGHGSLDVWRGVFSANDAPQLANQKHPAVFVMMSCLNGYFQDPTSDSLGEALMKSPGGAVAVWASSAMTYADSQVPMNVEFYRQLFATSRPRLGDAAVRAKASTHDFDVRRSWVLFGDPTMRLK